MTIEQFDVWKGRAIKFLQLALMFLTGFTGTIAGVKVCDRGGSKPPTTAPTPVPIPEKKPDPAADALQAKPDPVNAVCRIQFGRAGCSATIVAPATIDGRVQLLTANHCLDGQPKEGVAYLRDGRTFHVVQAGRWAGPDVGWLISIDPVKNMPWTMLAAKMPAAGDKVYHCGFGVDRPGNREDGVVVQPDNGQGQTEFNISVSSGDSGGGIALDADGHILSPVCCTTAKGQRARVWGATVEECKKHRPGFTTIADTWTPIEVPTREDVP